MFRTPIATTVRQSEAVLQAGLEDGLVSFHLKAVIAWFNGDVESHNV